jgi:phosphoribosylformimino-5-aminoimidazole carboxamide ribonucleotide (ProFAR) isomerase
MSGKVITLKQVQAVKGMNTVQVPVSTGLKAVHIVSLDGADMKYQSKKVMITN